MPYVLQKPLALCRCLCDAMAPLPCLPRPGVSCPDVMCAGNDNHFVTKGKVRSEPGKVLALSHYWSGKGKADRPVLQTQALSKGTRRLAMLPSGSLSSSVLLPPPNWRTLGRFLNMCTLPHKVGINLGSVHNGAIMRTCKPLAQWPGQTQWW